jgi:hypothetical protein
MARRKRKVDFTGIVRNKKLPILTLDNRWHELFTEQQKTSAIIALEQKVNSLLKQQGKLVNDIKDMKRLKKSLLKDIVDNMEISRDIIGKAKEKRIDKNKQYIIELNEKIDAAMEELAELPYQIKLVNEELLAESIHVFYHQLESSREEIREVSEAITNMREQLKEKILLKQDLEERSSLIYTYMHDILGAEIMEQFDNEHSKNVDK